MYRVKRLGQTRAVPAAVLVLMVLSPAIGPSAIAGGDPADGAASQVAAAETAAERGYRLLRKRPFLPPDFDNEVFGQLWTVWPEPLRSRAEKATPEERRKMAFSRYGLIDDPERRGQGPALGYIDDGRGGWVMSCLACHAGKVAGRVVPGLPNSHYALQTLTEDVRQVKMRLGKTFSHMDVGSLAMPLGGSNGTTNSVMFGVALGALRDRDMNVIRTRGVPKMVHHDMDAPPLWNVKRKSSLYCDGFSPRNHRVLVQFLLIPRNDAATVKGWEDEFRDILAWIESLEPPRYPWPVDRALAARGRIAFEAHCSQCHGTYGEGGRYEEQVVPLETVGTDPVRLRALTAEHRQWLKESWMSYHGEHPVETKPAGYVAPPLDGIWASAPYLHNGSVPTLWHLFHPDERPAVWKRTEDGYDTEKAGLEIVPFDEIPESAETPAERREYFDTRLPGKSAAGHRFPEKLTPEEKQAVLEYLKTL